jgi:hypothetical protein
MTVRRLKTYTGSHGYVYQYYFVGQRPAPSLGAVEYVFDVTSDRKTTYPVGIFLSAEVVTAWNQAHDRSLTESEQYAAVKLRLFRAFDELENMHEDGRSLHIDRVFLERALSELGID